MDFKKLLAKFNSTPALLPQRVVGIDVGSSSVKVVEVEKTDKALMLKTYGELQLGPYADKDLGESVTLEPQKLVEALVDVIRESGVKASHGVLSMPLSTSFVTVAPITVKEGEDIKSKINVEARKHIPVPLIDITLDWSVLNEYGDDPNRVYEILFAAIQNDSLNRYRELMAKIKMDSQPSEIEVFSTIRSLLRPDEQALGVIDLGAETSKLYIVHDGALERIHRVYEGGAACTRRLAKMLTVSFEEAEEHKRNYTPESPNARDIYKTYASSLERSVQEFDRVIKQYEARLGQQLDRVVVTGGAGAFDNAPKMMGDILARDVVRAKPFEKIAYPAFMEDTLNQIGISFSVALGAALRPYEVTE